MKFPRPFLLGFIVTALIPVAGRAQTAEKKSESAAIPKAPAGMCRLWVDGVPPNKQPAPTDCPTALRNKPTNGQVIFGDPRAPAKAAPASAASRLMFPPMAQIVAHPRAPGPKSAQIAHDGRPASRDSAKGGRDSGRAGHDSGRVGRENTQAKKPPPR